MLQEPPSQPRQLQVGWAVPSVTQIRPGRTRWEYLRIETRIAGEIESVSAGGDTDLQGLPIADALGRLGSSDWEVVSITPRGESTFLYTFKRPVAHP